MNKWTGRWTTVLVSLYVTYMNCIQHPHLSVEQSIHLYPGVAVGGPAQAIVLGAVVEYWRRGPSMQLNESSE
jgi:hypothetical protein